MNQLIGAVDNHNVASGEPSWLSNVGDAFSKGIPTAITSGVVSLINSAIGFAGWVSQKDFELYDTHEVLRQYDNDLARYYEDNKAGVDIAGFVGTSLIPGTIGVKALNLAKSGILGTNMLNATGLMQVVTKDYAKLARAQVATGETPFKILNENVLKALAQGVGSSALEFAAFETAVTAALYKSPVLDGQSVGDLTWNIIENSVIWGGGFGLAVKGAQTYFGVNKLRNQTNRESFPFREIEELGPHADPSLNIINYYHQKFNMPEVVLPLPKSELDQSTRFDLFTRQREETLSRLDIKLRAEFNKLAQGDDVIGNALFEAMNASAKSTEDVALAIFSSQKAGRITMGESLKVGDVHFPLSKVTDDGIKMIKDSGDYHLLFTTEGKNDFSRGYKITGNIGDLKVASSSPAISSTQEAWQAGFDVFRNFNGTLSINPASKILTKSQFARAENNLILDIEHGATVVDTAVPGLADLATKANPIRYERGTGHVFAGNLAPIKVDQNTQRFNPVDGDYLTAQARYIWAQSLPPRRWKEQTIHEFDFPLLEKAYFSGEDLSGMRIKRFGEDKKAEVFAAPTGEGLRHFIEDRKIALVHKMGGKSLTEQSYRLNVTEEWLQGSAEGWSKFNTEKNFFDKKSGSFLIPPRFARIDMEEGVKAVDQMVINQTRGMVEYYQQRDVIMQRYRQTAATYFGTKYENFPEYIDFHQVGMTPTEEGAGASLFGFANANAGTLSGKVQYIGTQTAAAKLFAKTEAKKILDPVSAQVAQIQGKEAELAILTNHLRGFASEDSWVFHPTKGDTLIQQKNLRWEKKSGNWIISPDAPTVSMSPEVGNYMRTHMELIHKRQPHIDNIKGDQIGVGSDHDLLKVYVPPVNTVNYKHFVLVEPKEIHTGDKKRVLVAKDEETLRKLIAQVDQDKFKVWTKKDSEEYHKAFGDYEYALGMNESAVDSAMHRKGVLKEMFPTITGGKVLEEYMAWHMRQEESLVMSMVAHMYAPQFAELKELGRGFSNISSSQFRSNLEAVEKIAKDPYNDLIKTALDISRASEYPVWTNFNDLVRIWVERPMNKARELFRKTSTIDAKFVAEVNAAADAAGLGNPIQSTYSALAASGNIVDKPWLSKGIAQAQSILTTTLLQWDMLNAVNNTMGATIVGSSELKYLINAIEKANPEVAGKLTSMRNVAVPDGSGLTIPTVAKLQHQAIRNFFNDRQNQLGHLKRYTDIGAVTDDIFHQMHMMLDNLTWNFTTQTAAQTESMIHKAAEFGRKWTGNKMAEQFSRYLTADSVRQITDIAIEAGVLKNAREANEWIKLVTDKAQGNYLYSQRPIIFQGVVGQAISLFQTYQFNLMQQLFKYIGNSDTKSLAMLVGLQGSIYGMQGLPAFNFLNTHIVGNASGNTNHRDLYYAANSVFGKSLGDWILYGLGSNALSVVDPSARFNLYSRGDINPRQLTVLPTDLEDIPIVSASVRLVKNLFGTVSKVANGAALWPSITQAIEHNGLSRPLAGLAQLTQGYTTTNQGSLLTAPKDVWTIGQMMRLAGGKPFDEAIALDNIYRMNAYRAKDQSNARKLGSAIKTVLVGGGQPTEEQIIDFAASYAKGGGRVENFNRFFTNAMLASNESQVNKMAEDLSRPFAQHLQIIMGGVPLPDFYNRTQE